MKYNNLYNKLIESRRNFGRHKKNDGLLEMHHIVPTSLGGNNDKDNLILLTPREHYLAHWLLYKIHIGQDKARMAYAFFMMSRNNPNQKRDITSRQYERAKQAMSESCRGGNHPTFGKPMWTEEQKAAISKRQTGENNSMYGKVPWNKGKKLPPLSEEIKKKISDSNKGKVHSEETRKKLSDAHKGKVLSDETKRKLSEINKGKKIPKDIVEKTAAKLRGKKHPITTCPHCGKTGGHTAMYRWHFDNCKEVFNE